MRTFLGEVWYRLKKWAMGWLHLGPHFVVGPDDNPYLLRWYLIPRNPLLNLYLHKFLRDDDDRARHDHPWLSASLLLVGKYREETSRGKKEYRAGSVIVRRATYQHRIELLEGRPCWTLFITGPVQREWGFHCSWGWRPWKEFVLGDKPGQVGKGCD